MAEPSGETFSFVDLDNQRKDYYIELHGLINNPANYMILRPFVISAMSYMSQRRDYLLAIKTGLQKMLDELSKQREPNGEKLKLPSLDLYPEVVDMFIDDIWHEKVNDTLPNNNHLVEAVRAALKQSGES